MGGVADAPVMYSTRNRPPWSPVNTIAREDYHQVRLRTLVKRDKFRIYTESIGGDSCSCVPAKSRFDTTVLTAHQGALRIEIERAGAHHKPACMRPPQ